MSIQNTSELENCVQEVAGSLERLAKLLKNKFPQSNSHSELNGKALLSTVQAARYLGISPKTLYNRCCKKASNPFPVKPKRIGRRVLFDVRDLDSYVDSLPYDGSELD